VLTPIINDHGLDYFPDNNFSVFGSSRPDLAFVKHSQGKAVAVAVDFPHHSESMEHCHEVGKRKDIMKNHCQCYANMIRVANDSFIVSLRCGVLIESTTVYGLLVSHTEFRCLPMKYIFL